MWFIQCIECSKCFAGKEWYYLLVTRYLCYKKIFIVLSTNNGTMLATSHGQKKRTRCKLCFVFPLFHWKRIFCRRVGFPNVLEYFLTQTEEVLLKKKGYMFAIDITKWKVLHWRIILWENIFWRLEMEKE